MAEPKKLHYNLPHISADLLEKIIQKLEQMREESLRIVNANVHNDLTPDNKEQDDVGDDIDQATKAREREFSLLIHERHLRRLQQIEEAFDKMRDGTFGLCEGTEEPINPKRLVIMPLARFSLEYQEEQERLHGRTMGEFSHEDQESFEQEE
ncbi:MAG: TraR/DksA C4-type zinc finger protein [Deltaproteobacteria bacterium]|nr:TraR/DksA C4-type zinc finger protein [Deltaproteobacteria bacterium]